MSMMIWQITSNAYRGTEKAGKYDSVFQYARISLKRLTDDLSMAFLVAPALQGRKSDGTPYFETQFIGEDRGDSDYVYFMSFSNTRLIKNEKKGDVVKIAYSLEECPDSEEKKSCLMRKDLFSFEKDIKDAGVSFPVAENVKKFNLEYYDTAKSEWRGDWNTKDPVYLGKLPRAVRITLVFTDPKSEEEEMFFTTETLLPLSSGLIDF